MPIKFKNNDTVKCTDVNFRMTRQRVETGLRMVLIRWGKALAI